MTLGVFAQSGKTTKQNLNNQHTKISFEDRKERGFYSAMQIGFLLGNKQEIERPPTYYPLYNIDYASSVYPSPGYSQPQARNKLAFAPSVALTGGYMFSEHWAAGAGIGFEIFEHNLFPLFAELRYTLWDSKISPFIVLKGGYAFGSFNDKDYDELYLSWTPYYLSDAKLRHYGGLMIHPEIGVKVPLNADIDLLFTAAYRHQKTKSVARREYDQGQFDEWEHNEDYNRLSLGCAIMFR